MLIKEESINRFFNGKAFFILMAVIFLIATPIAMLKGRVPVQGSTSGVLFSSASVLNLLPTLSMWLNIIAILGICALMIELNKIFSFIRQVTLLYGSMFLMLQVSDPYVTTTLFDGTLLALFVVATTYIIFNSFQSSTSKRSIYITFTILSAACTFQYAFLYLIPVYFIGFLQMRAMSLKGTIAMILGLITPFWILLGFGIVTFSDFMPPHLANVWDHLDLTQSGMLISSAAITGLLTLILLVVNAFHILSYRTQIRAYNGFFTILSVFTILAMMIDYNNILIYLPMLNICLAIQIAHFFTINTYRRRYLIIFLFIIACTAIYLWRITY